MDDFDRQSFDALSNAIKFYLNNGPRKLALDEKYGIVYGYPESPSTRECWVAHKTLLPFKINAKELNGETRWVFILWVNIAGQVYCDYHINDDSTFYTRSNDIYVLDNAVVKASNFAWNLMEWFSANVDGKYRRLDKLQSLVLGA